MWRNAQEEWETAVSKIETSLVSEMETKPPDVQGINRHSFEQGHQWITHLVHIELALPSS